MTYFFTLIYAILGGFARRWFGGALENYKVLKNRGVQTVFMCLLFFSIYLPHYDWALALVITTWLQFVFWSIGHGPAFDYGTGGTPDETLINRYKKYHLNVIPDYFANKGCFPYYGEWYDYTWMTVRYTAPMIPMMVFDLRYILLGFLVSLVYLFCWGFNVKGKKDWCNAPTKIAEIICGALVFGSCYLLG